MANLFWLSDSQWAVMEPFERHLAEARLPPGKTLDTFDFETVPMVSKAQVMAVAVGDAWLATGANLLLAAGRGQLR